jgi:uncharacterized protein (TIGR02246 family)
MNSKDMESIVRELADREAIRDLASRYADCIWRNDASGAADLFTEDGEMDTGDRPPIVGRETLREVYRGMLQGPELQPFVHNHLIELQGDDATGVCYLDLRATMEGRSMIGSGFYHDCYQRVDGVWKFRSRKLTMRHFAPLSEGWAESQREG